MLKMIFIWNLVFLVLGGCMSDGRLIKDIRSLSKPDGFEQVEINFVLEKYIVIGMSKGVADSFFKSEGFSSFVKKDDEFEGVTNKIYWIRYLDDLPSHSKKYKIVVEINLIHQKVSSFSGVYLKHMY